MPTAGTWPTIDDLAKFTSQAVDDETLQWALDAAIAYGIEVLDYTDGVLNLPTESCFQGCLDYAGSLFTQRIGAADVVVDAYGTTPQQRYRRILLAARPVAFA